MVLIFTIPWSVLTRFFNLFASTFCFFTLLKLEEFLVTLDFCVLLGY